MNNLMNKISGIRLFYLFIPLYFSLFPFSARAEKGCLTGVEIPDLFAESMRDFDFVLVGETHGVSAWVTDRVPLLEAAICSKRKLLVGLEGVSAVFQPELEKYLKDELTLEELDQRIGIYSSIRINRRAQEFVKNFVKESKRLRLPLFLIEGESEYDGREKASALLSDYIPEEHQRTMRIPQCSNLSGKKLEKCNGDRERFLNSWVDMGLLRFRLQNYTRDRGMAAVIKKNYDLNADEKPLVFIYSGGVHTASIPAFLVELGLSLDQMIEFQIGPENEQISQIKVVREKASLEAGPRMIDVGSPLTANMVLLPNIPVSTLYYQYAREFIRKTR